MSRLRLILLVVTCAIIVCVTWAVLGGARSGPGEGEVSVILHGAFMVIGAALAAFFAVVAVMIALWHRRRLRIVLLMVTGGAVALTGIWIGYASLTTYLADKAHARDRAAQETLSKAREAAIAPIARRFYQQLVSAGTAPDGIAGLRKDFEAEVAALGFAKPEYANATTYFQSAHDIYMRLFLNGDGAMGQQLGVYNAAACVHIQTDLSDRFEAEQTAIFAEICPDWLMVYAR